MKATELRIGNYVWDDYSGEMIVSQIYQSNLSLRKTVNLPEGIYGIDNVEPIPLTEEWLLKTGFEQDKITKVIMIYDADSWDITWVNDILFIFCYNYMLLDNSLEHIKYVHQLQNLYFALTGEELIIKTN